MTRNEACSVVLDEILEVMIVISRSVPVFGLVSGVPELAEDLWEARYLGSLMDDNR